MTTLDDLVRASFVMAMREDLLGISTEQQTIKKILAEQAEALGGTIIALSDLQPAVARLDGRLDQVDGRLNKMDSRQDRMDKNVEAIMRHLGIPPNK